MYLRSLLLVCALATAGVVAVPGVAGAVESGDYVVVLRDTTSPDDVAARAKSDGATIGHVYRAALTGFSAHLTERAYTALRANPNVLSITEDVPTVVAGNVQPAPPVHLDRVDQRALAPSGSYSYNDTGAGVTAYVVDTGIRATHSEYAGRVVATHDATGGTGADCHGHGTFVASQVGGASNGTAKGVDLVNVRVFGCTSGTAADLIAGIDWITADHDPGEDAVANVSILVLGGYGPLDTATANAIADGVTFAVAGGNNNRDACIESPSKVATAITVGAADPTTDARASFSDYGSCIDLFAPGVNNIGASYTSDTAVATGSGTSFASPLTAGVAALYLQQNPGATPATVAAAITGHATQGIVTGSLSAPHDDLLFQDTYVVSTAYCDAGNVAGNINYNVGAPSPTVNVNTSWTLNLNLSCTHPPTTGGVQTLALGTYQIAATGNSVDNCATGTGAGVVTGTAKTGGPEQGTILPGGLWRYSRYGIHYYGYPTNGDGYFTLVDPLGWHRKYRMYLWLDYVPTTSNQCPKAGNNALIGHATFATE